MESYRVYHSKTFDDKLKDMPKDFIEWVDRIESQLVTNPYVGKPLGVGWLRKKKYLKYRIYYLVYEDLISVFMVNISEKKDQHKVINTIKLFLDTYKEEIMKLSRN